uniref:Zinc finger, CCHC-type n=1 Tax=Tanacetum cinerariifolium TaxID=118510 RepID=A0A6L2J221_TANCI|nr:zinc finger, CCHC-type [Tanacetum cinerariifolium]
MADEMYFLLSSMSMVYVLTTHVPKDGGDDETVEQIRKMAKWDNDDYVCRGLILNGSHLHIKESLRMQESDKVKGKKFAGPLVVNMVEHNNSSRYNDNKGKRKYYDNTRTDPNKKSKVTCWKCGKPGHLKKSLQRIMMLRGGLTQEQQFMCVKIDVGSRPMSLNDGSILYMENFSTTLVHGRSCVDLKFSFGKIVSLFNVLRVPNIRKNLVTKEVVQQPKLEKEAINDEMDSIMGNNTWVLVDLPLCCKPLGCKWIFKRKLKVDGTIEKLKARKFNEISKGVIICLFVDDKLIFGTDQVQVNLTKEFLSSWFAMKDMMEANVILGIKIKHESHEIAISQSYYIDKVIYVVEFMVLEDLGNIIDSSVSEVVLGKPFAQASKLTYEESLRLIRFAHSDDEVAFAPKDKIIRSSITLGKG